MALRLFYSYSSKDESLRSELEAHLSSLRREGLIEAWNFGKISPGEEWDAEIAKELDRADIVLLLISADFLNSDYCWGVEVKRALQRHAQGDAVVIPIILRPCDWKTQEFSKLQALPSQAKPVVKTRPRDEAWADIARGIRKVTEDHLRNIPISSSKASLAGTTTHDQVARSRVEAIADAFMSGRLKERQIAARELERLAMSLSLQSVLDLSKSEWGGQRVAAGIALREHLLHDALLSTNPSVIAAVKRGLQDDHARVRYRFIRAATTYSSLAMCVADILRWIQTADRDKSLQIAAREALDVASRAG